VRNIKDYSLTSASAIRGPIDHKVTLEEGTFSALLSYAKKALLYPDSCLDFLVGDTLLITEKCAETKSLTGREFKARISHISKNDQGDFPVLCLSLETPVVPHVWVPGSSVGVRADWTVCSKCGEVKSAKSSNVSCVGRSRIDPRDP